MGILLNLRILNKQVEMGPETMPFLTSSQVMPRLLKLKECWNKSELSSLSGQYSSMAGSPVSQCVSVPYEKSPRKVVMEERGQVLLWEAPMEARNWGLQFT